MQFLRIEMYTCIAISTPFITILRVRMFVCRIVTEWRQVFMILELLLILVLILYICNGV